MTVTLEHVRHRAEYFDEADRRLAWTKLRMVRSA